MKCCIFGGDIEKEYAPDGVRYWDGGHNPYPIKESGSCCGKCNKSVVEPAQRKLLREAVKKGDI